MFGRQSDLTTHKSEIFKISNFSIPPPIVHNPRFSKLEWMDWRPRPKDQGSGTQTGDPGQKDPRTRDPRLRNNSKTGSADPQGSKKRVRIKGTIPSLLSLPTGSSICDHRGSLPTPPPLARERINPSKTL